MFHLFHKTISKLKEIKLIDKLMVEHNNKLNELLK